MERGASVSIECEVDRLTAGDGKKPRGGLGGPLRNFQFSEVFMQVNWLPCTPTQEMKNGDVIIHNSLIMEVSRILSPFSSNLCGSTQKAPRLMEAVLESMETPNVGVSRKEFFLSAVRIPARTTQIWQTQTYEYLQSPE